MTSLAPFNLKHHAPRALPRALALLCMGLAGCGLFQRHHDAPNQELDRDLDGDATVTTSSVLAPTADERAVLARQVFSRGVEAHGKGDFAAAAKIFAGFVEDFPGADGYETAHALLGESLFNLGRYAEAEKPLKRTIENSADGELSTRSTLMLAESLHLMKRDDEALVATFQLVPDKELQARLALPPHAARRQARAPKVRLADQVRAYLLQASILGALKEDKKGDEVFHKGKRLLSQATGYGISKTEAHTLRGEMGWREMGILGRQCSEKARPEKGSEEAVAASMQEFYRCIEPSKALLCDVKRDAPAPLLQRAKDAYKALVQKPRELKEDLPAPERAFKDESTKAQFMAELGIYIDRTVDAKTVDFRNLEECGLPAVF